MTFITLSTFNILQLCHSKRDCGPAAPVFIHSITYSLWKGGVMPPPPPAGLTYPLEGNDSPQVIHRHIQVFSQASFKNILSQA